ncbi:MAG TPA: hypothetical protein V6D23_28725, partial [Candidatus Obscuribacterales bacterium]
MSPRIPASIPSTQQTTFKPRVGPLEASPVTTQPGQGKDTGTGNGAVTDFEFSLDNQTGTYSNVDLKGNVQFKNTTGANGEVQTPITDRINKLSPDTAKSMLTRMLANNQDQANPGMVALLMARSKGYTVENLSFDPKAKQVSFSTKENPNVCFNIALGPPPNVFGSKLGEDGNWTRSEDREVGSIRDAFAGGPEGEGALGAVMDEMWMARDAEPATPDTAPAEPDGPEKTEEPAAEGTDPAGPADPAGPDDPDDSAEGPG